MDNGSFAQGAATNGFDQPADDFDQFSTYDTTGVTEESLQSGGGVQAPGKYHFMVAAVECEAPDPSDENPRTPCARIVLEVLPAPYPSEAERKQIGKKTSLRCYVAKKDMQIKKDASGNTVYKDNGDPEYQFVGWIPVSDGQRDINMRVALALGIITPEQLGHAETKITKAMWESCVGRQCHGEVSANEDTYNNQTRIRYEVSFGQVWPVHHEDVKDWPKDAEALQFAAVQSGAVAQAPGAAAPLPSDMDDLSNLAGT